MYLRKNINKSLTVVVIAAAGISSVFSQQEYRNVHREFPDDPYLKPQGNRETSPGYKSSNAIYFTGQVNVDSNGDNIVGDAANEPSIAINPNNSNSILIGWRQFDDIHSNFRQAGYAFTLDGGHNWNFPGVLEPGVFRSDPVLGFDKGGNFYYNSLTVSQNNNYTCDVFRSYNGGFTWDDPVFAQGGDKQWMIIDRTESIGEGNIYASWNKNFSSCYPGQFTRSVDHGDSYESCTAIDGGPKWGTMAVGIDGVLYIAGVDDSHDFLISKSTNAKDSTQPVTWQHHTYVDMGGYIQFQAPPNPAGLLGQVWVAADTSDGAGRGNVYMLCSVKPGGSNDPCDVMFVRSTDGGGTWDDPVRINDDPLNNGAWQWFGTMSVAPNGRIDVVWLDTRDNPGTYLSSLYYSYSMTQGQSWSANQRISEAFDPHLGWPQQEKMGDYFHMVSLLDGAYLAWANTLNGEQDVYFTKIYSGFDKVDDVTAANGLKLTVYPNPVRNAATIHYSIPRKGAVRLIITDVTGKHLFTVADKTKPAGDYYYIWDASRFPAGIYFAKLSVSGKSKFVKLVRTN